MEDWLASVPDWAKAAVSVLGTIGGIALTWTISKIGGGQGRAKAKEEAVTAAAAPLPLGDGPGQIPAQLVGIGGALLERTTAETLIKVGSSLSLSVNDLVGSVDRLAAMYERWIERMEDDAERAKIREELEREAETRRVLEELNRLRSERQAGKTG